MSIPEELAETISSSDGGVTIYFKKAWEGIFQVIDFYGGSNLGLTPLAPPTIVNGVLSLIQNYLSSDNGN